MPRLSTPARADPMGPKFYPKPLIKIDNRGQQIGPRPLIHIDARGFKFGTQGPQTRPHANSQKPIPGNYNSAPSRTYTSVSTIMDELRVVVLQRFQAMTMLISRTAGEHKNRFLVWHRKDPRGGPQPRKWLQSRSPKAMTLDF